MVNSPYFTNHYIGFHVIHVQPLNTSMVGTIVPLLSVSSVLCPVRWMPVEDSRPFRVGALFRGSRALLPGGLYKLYNQPEKADLETCYALLRSLYCCFYTGVICLCGWVQEAGHRGAGWGYGGPSALVKVQCESLIKCKLCYLFDQSILKEIYQYWAKSVKDSCQNS